MIRDLYAIVDKPAQRMLTMLLIASALAAAAQGIALWDYSPSSPASFPVIMR